MEEDGGRREGSAGVVIMVERAAYILRTDREKGCPQFSDWSIFERCRKFPVLQRVFVFCTRKFSLCVSVFAFGQSDDISSSMVENEEMGMDGIILDHFKVAYMYASCT